MNMWVYMYINDYDMIYLIYVTPDVARNKSTAKGHESPTLICWSSIFSQQPEFVWDNLRQFIRRFQ